MDKKPTSDMARNVACDPRRSDRERRAFTIWYMGICLFVLLGLVSFGVDIGRLQAAKTELQRAVDAAARYGASGLTTGDPIKQAMIAAAENTVDADGKHSLTLASSEVTPGIWNNSTRTFTASNSAPNALKVSVARSIPLMFAAALGKSACTVTATAIAINNAAGPNFIGLEGITAKNNASMGYSSSQGNPGGVNQTNTFLMGSNGAIAFEQNLAINGGVVLGPGGSFNKPSPTPMQSATPLSYPATETPPIVSSGDLHVSGSTHISGGGTKVYTNITFSNNAELVFDQPTTVYITGNVDAAQGSVIRAGSGVPKDLNIRMSGGPSKYFGGSNANNLVVTALVYAPDVDFSSKNNADIYGSVLFRTIDVKNNINAYYDTDSGSVVAGLGTIGGSNIALVR